MAVPFPESPVEADRLKLLHPGSGEKSPRGGYVLYWMQKSQRAFGNPALEQAAAAAAGIGLPLLVLFCLADFPGASPVHYRFMLRGLKETAKDLRSRGAAFAILRGHPPALAAGLAREAALVVCDAGRLRVERAWRAELAAALAAQERPPALLEVEAEAVVPPDSASRKEEWSAATLRRKIEGALPFYLHELPAIELPVDGRLLGTLGDDALFAAYDAPFGPAYPGDRAPEQRPSFVPGQAAGMARYAAFLDQGLERYAAERSDPSKEGQSGMSPYLHFGQVSAVELARLARLRGEAAAPGRRRGPAGPARPLAEVAAAFLEELVVRRELAANYVLRNPDYDGYAGVPAWARASLAEAALLPGPIDAAGARTGKAGAGTGSAGARKAAAGETSAAGAAGAPQARERYSPGELEAARTADPYWNAAQDEMVLTGKMHNYLRMYWGKKILEWSSSPEEAFATALRLNDRYSLDGRDPNGCAGVAWCFGKHDRPWTRRPVFGSVRYMNAAGLRRKFDIEAYVGRIEALRSSIAQRPSP